MLVIEDPAQVVMQCGADCRLEDRELRGLSPGHPAQVLEAHSIPTDKTREPLALLGDTEAARQELLKALEIGGFPDEEQARAELARLDAGV